MNMKKFCGIAAAVTVMLCAAGCGDDSSSEIYLNNTGMNVAGKNQSPAAAAGGYRAGSSREILVTAGTAEKGAEGAEAVTSYVTEEDYSMRGNYGDGRSEWFNAHTLFNMEEGDDDSFFSGTWYRFNNHGETYTSTVVMFETIPNTGLRDEQKMPDTLLTKAPAGDGKNIGSGGNKNTAGTTAAVKTSTAQGVMKKK